MKLLRWVFYAVVFMFGVVFALLNHKTVVVDYFWQQSSLPLALVVLGAFLSGVLFGRFIR